MSEQKKGRKLSADHRAKLSQAGLGRTKSQQTRNKHSEANKGRVLSIESRTKISNSLKGNIPWNRIGDRPMTGAEYQKRYRERKKLLAKAA
jgi:hypothetical protein